jgi:hypothetical protein
MGIEQAAASSGTTSAVRHSARGETLIAAHSVSQSRILFHREENSFNCVSFGKCLRS